MRTQDMDDERSKEVWLMISAGTIGEGGNPEGHIKLSQGLLIFKANSNEWVRFSSVSFGTGGVEIAPEYQLDNYKVKNAHS